MDRESLRQREGGKENHYNFTFEAMARYGGEDQGSAALKHELDEHRHKTRTQKVMLPSDEESPAGRTGSQTPAHEP